MKNKRPLAIAVIVFVILLPGSGEYTPHLDAFIWACVVFESLRYLGERRDSVNGPN